MSWIATSKIVKITVGSPDAPIVYKLGKHYDKIGITITDIFAEQTKVNGVYHYIIVITDSNGDEKAWQSIPVTRPDIIMTYDIND